MEPNQWEAFFKDLGIGSEFDKSLMVTLNKESYPFQSLDYLDILFKSMEDKTIDTLIKNLNKETDIYFPYTNGSNIDIDRLSKFLGCENSDILDLFGSSSQSISIDLFKSTMDKLLKKYISAHQ